MCGIAVVDGASLEGIRQSPLAVQNAGMLTSSSFRAPGDILNGYAAEDKFLRGHGVQSVDGRFISHVCGILERMDRLLRVRPLHVRFAPETGDVIIGRVIDVAKDRWKLDICSRLSASLHLYSVELPGQEQRRRNAVDELNMRSLYGQNDLISAEVQSLQTGGAAVLHTRNLKYGSLSKGQLISISPTLVKRVQHHFHQFPQVTGESATEIVSARNGRIFVGACTTGNMNKRDTDRSSSTLSRSEREQICRVSNIVRMFSLLSLPICPYRILEVSKKSVQWGFVPRDILTPSFQKLVEANYIEIS